MWSNEPMEQPRTPDLSRNPLPLRGRNVLVTGVSRRSGIGYATACRDGRLWRQRLLPPLLCARPGAALGRG